MNRRQLLSTLLLAPFATLLAKLGLRRWAGTTVPRAAEPEIGGRVANYSYKWSYHFVNGQGKIIASSTDLKNWVTNG